MTEEIKKPELFEQYDFETYAQFWNDIYHNTDFNGAVFFCGRTRKNNFYTINIRSRSEVNEYLQSLQITPVLDYYYSINQFIKKKGSDMKRSSSNFLAACGTVVDIDIHNKSIPIEEINKTLNTYIGKLDSLVLLNEAFPYNYVLQTGRGLQFVYIYQKPVNYKLSIMHERVQELILKQHQQLLDDNPQLNVKIDSGTTKKKSGVYRMPGTYNVKAKRKVTLTKTDYPFLDNSRIIDTYGFFDIPPNYKPKEHKISKKYANSNLYKIRINRCHQILDIIRKYQEDDTAWHKHPGHENRNCTCFVYIHFLLEVMSCEDTFKEVCRFNNRYRIPLPVKRLRYMVDYAYRNYTDETKYRMRHLKTFTVQDYLNLDDGEYGLYDTSKIRKQKELERKKKREEQEAKYDKIIELYPTGMTLREIAKEVGFCVDTVRKIADKYYKPTTDKKCPWEELGISRSTYYRRKKTEPIRLQKEQEKQKTRDEFTQKKEETRKQKHSEIISLYKKGMSQRKIAKELKVSRKTIQSVLDKKFPNRHNKK